MHVFKKHNGIIHRHFQYIADRFSAVAYLQRFTVVTLAHAFFTFHVNIRQKIHFNKFHATTLAFFATSAFYIKRKSPCFVSADF